MASPPEQPLGFSWLMHDKSGELQVRRDGQVVVLMRGGAVRARVSGEIANNRATTR